MPLEKHQGQVAHVTTQRSRWKHKKLRCQPPSLSHRLYFAILLCTGTIKEVIKSHSPVPLCNHATYLRRCHVREHAEITLAALLQCRSYLTDKSSIAGHTSSNVNIQRSKSMLCQAASLRAALGKQTPCADKDDPVRVALSSRVNTGQVQKQAPGG